MTKIIISGCGLITPFGIGVPTFVDNLFNGRSAVFEHGRALNQYSFGLDVAEGDACASRAEAMLGIVCQEALIGSQFTSDASSSTIVIACTRAGSVGLSLARIAPQWLGYRFNELRTLVGHAAAIIQVSAACASCGYAISIAQSILLQGRARHVVIVGAEADLAPEIAGMHAVRALGSAGPHPFDLSRDGTALAEGAGCIVLEAVPDTTALLGGSFVELCGVSTVTDASERSHASGAAFEKSMTAAWRSSGVNEVDLLQAHAAGTEQGDLAEVRAAREVFGTRLPAVTSHKGAIGHLLYSSGFPGIVAAIAAIDRQTVPPCSGLNELDPALGEIAISNRCVEREISTAMVNMAGFYGNHSSLVIQKSRV